MPLLSPGDSFPALTLTPPGGPALMLPDAFAGDFGVVLFFRGPGARTATRSCGPSSGPVTASRRPGSRLRRCRWTTNPLLPS